MKKIAKRMALLSASLMIFAAPVLADEGMPRGMHDNAGAFENKNECLLVAMNCGNSVDSIQQRIERIKKEIARGDVYTNDEIRRLKDQLDEANRNFELINSGA